MIEIKEFFRKGRKLNFEIQELKIARQEAFDLACGTSVVLGEEKTQSTQGNSIERKFISYAEYSKMLDEKIEELNGYRKDMLNVINKIPDTTYRTLLTARYINCETWEMVAETIGYSDVWVRTNLHNRALTEANKYFVK